MTLFTALSLLAASGWAAAGALALHSRKYGLAAVAFPGLIIAVMLPFVAEVVPHTILPLLLAVAAAIAVPAAFRGGQAQVQGQLPARDLFDELPDPSMIWKRTRGGQIVLDRANRAAHSLLPSAPESFAGTSVNEFFSHAPHVADYIQEAFNSGAARRVELLYSFHRGGPMRWVQADYVPITGDRLLNSVRDISDQKAAEQALSENEERLRRLYEVTFEGIGLTDNGVFIDANRQLADMLGEPLAYLVGKRVAEYIDPQSTAAITDSGEAPGGVAFEHRARRKDGYTFPVEIRSRKGIYIRVFEFFV